MSDDGKSVEDLQMLKNNYLIAQYQALREEILKNSEIRYQILGLTFIIAGTFLTIGVQSNSSALTIMVYPILGSFLAGAWGQRERGVGRINRFIRQNYEEKLFQLGELGWETSVYKHYKPWWSFSFERLGIRGVFLVTQILTLALAVSRFSFSLQSDILLALDCIAILITPFLLSKPRR